MNVDYTEHCSVWSYGPTNFIETTTTTTTTARMKIWMKILVEDF